jgi:hypothetical protein
MVLPQPVPSPIDCQTGRLRCACPTPCNLTIPHPASSPGPARLCTEFVNSADLPSALSPLWRHSPPRCGPTASGSFRPKSLPRNDLGFCPYPRTYPNLGPPQSILVRLRGMLKSQHRRPDLYARHLPTQRSVPTVLCPDRTLAATILPRRSAEGENAVRSRGQMPPR